MNSSLKKACKRLHKVTPKGIISIGKNIWVAKSAIIDITGNINIGNNVIISERVQLYTHYHDHSGTWIKYDGKNIYTIHKILCDGVFLYECIVTAKCNYIAKGVVIGVGSVVTKPIYDEFTIWAGNPARRIKNR